MNEFGLLLAEGKTKKIWSNPAETESVFIQSKDDVTAGDGLRRESFENKGLYSTEITCNCFELLTRNGIPNHFIRRVDETTFLARNLKMIPIEVVIRGIATGSYLKRCPDVMEGTLFSSPIIEFFTKDDKAHDPLIIYDFVGKRILFYSPKYPLAEGFIKELPIDNIEDALSKTLECISLVRRTFFVLRDAWARQDVTIVDLKIECGVDVSTGKIIVGDVITNDEWRIWPGGIKANQLDKQFFREMTEITPDSMNTLKNNFAKVARMTKLFIR